MDEDEEDEDEEDEEEKEQKKTIQTPPLVLALLGEQLCSAYPRLLLSAEL